MEAAHLALGMASAGKDGVVALITGVLIPVAGPGKDALRCLVIPILGIHFILDDETVPYLPVVEKVNSKAGDKIKAAHLDGLKDAMAIGTPDSDLLSVGVTTTDTLLLPVKMHVI